MSTAWTRWKPVRFACVLAALAACERSVPTGSTVQPHSPRKVVYCDEPDPNNPDCMSLVDTEPIEWDGYIADGSSDPADPAAPMWDGQAVEAYESEEVRPFCPFGWPSPTFGVRVILTNESAVFEIPSTAFLSSVIGRTRTGYPIGAYETPPGYWNDLSGKYQAYGGFIIAECHVVQIRAPHIASVVTGYLRSIDFTGNIWLNRPDGRNGSSSRGWGYHVTTSGQTVGYSDSHLPGVAQQVADAYMTGGTCTPGWELWVDGVQVCKSDGTRVA